MLLSLLGGCAHASYVLVVDAADQGASRLCEVESVDDATGTTTRTCRPLSGAAISAPSQLSIELAHAAPDARYRARIASETSEAASADPGAVVGEVLGRLGQLGTMFAHQLTPSGSGAHQAETERGIRQDLLARVLDETRLGGSASVRTLAHTIVGTAVPPESHPTDVFRAYVDATPALVDSPAGPASPTAFGFPAAVPPPSRTVRWTEEDLRALIARAPGTDGARLTAFLAAHCEHSHWGDAPPAPTAQAWSDYVSAHPLSDDDALVAALDVGEDQLRHALTDESQSLSERVMSRIRRAREAVRAGAPSDADRLIVYVAQSAPLHHALEICRANIDFAMRQQIIPTAGQAAALRALRDDVDGFLGRVSSPAQIFETLLQPLITAVATEVLAGVAEEGTVHFGSYSTRPGSLHVEVTSRAGDDALETRLAVVDMTIGLGPIVAVSIGPYVSFGDFHQIRERLAPGAAAIDAPVRVFADESSWFGGGSAINVHFSLLRVDAENHFGLMVGYPFVDARGSQLGVLAGASYRHTFGLEVAVGVHVFATDRFSSSVSPTNGILTLQGANAALSRDAAVTQVPSAALFVMIGLSTDALMRL